MWIMAIYKVFHSHPKKYAKCLNGAYYRYQTFDCSSWKPQLQYVYGRWSQISFFSKGERVCFQCFSSICPTSQLHYAFRPLLISIHGYEIALHMEHPLSQIATNHIIAIMAIALLWLMVLLNLKAIRYLFCLFFLQRPHTDCEA